MDGLLSPKKIHSISSILELHALIHYTDYHSLLTSSLAQTIKSRHLLIHAACIHNCILNKAGTCTHTCAFQTCRATLVANPVKVGIQEKRNAANAAYPICYTRIGKDRERRIMGHYRCEYTAAVETDRTWFGMLHGHRLMVQRTMQGGTREACINVISDLPIMDLAKRLLPLPSTNKPVPTITSHVPQFSASKAHTMENKTLITGDL